MSESKLQSRRMNPMLWLCNLGFHKPIKGGAMSGRTQTFEIGRGSSRTLSYLDCQRCGREYPGSIMVPDYRRFP